MTRHDLRGAKVALAIEPLPTDTPPFFAWDIPELGGPVRCYLLQPEQRYAFRQRLAAAGVKRETDLTLDGLAEAAYEARRLLLIKLVQACTRAAEGRPKLAAPGDEGFGQLAAMPDEALLDLANQIISHSCVVPQS